MPNHCQNLIRITAKAVEQPALLGEREFDGAWWKVFEESVASGNTNAPLCSLFKPMPAFVRCTGEWYEWACEHWGTKWGDYDGEIVSIDVDPNTNLVTVVYRFLSAWGPPTALVGSISEVVSSVTLHYYEAGMGFGGTMRFVDGPHGRLVEDTELDGSSDDCKKQMEELCADGGFSHVF